MATSLNAGKIPRNSISTILKEPRQKDVTPWLPLREADESRGSVREAHTWRLAKYLCHQAAESEQLWPNRSLNHSEPRNLLCEYLQMPFVDLLHSLQAERQAFLSSPGVNTVMRLAGFQSHTSKLCEVSLAQRKLHASACPLVTAVSVYVFESAPLFGNSTEGESVDSVRHVRCNDDPRCRHEY